MGQERVFQRHQQHIFFKNQDLDFYLSWAMGFSTYQGAELGECLYIASQINESDPASWVRAWKSMAAHLEQAAAFMQTKSRLVSARETYLRAMTYYRFASLCQSPQDADLPTTWQRMRECFRKVAELSNPPVIPLQIPFDGKTLTGYFMRPDATGARRPTLLAVSGGDGVAEDMYFFGGAAGIRRGYNVLMFEGPGQGQAILDGMSVRLDTEALAHQIVDFALGLPEVDGERLAIYGISGGGYAVTRAAAFEKRIKACIANPSIIDLSRLIQSEWAAFQKAPNALKEMLLRIITRRNPVVQVALSKLLWSMGVNRITEYMEKVKQARVEVEQIECAMLCMVSTADPAECIRQTHECYDRLRGQKAIRVFTAEEGAEAHCQVNNLSLSNQTLFDWLDEVLM
ncbi:MAG: alpha/beta hydrolase [Oscillochloridaceae bacterium]|nr:alpha/beta hydrolase [Chloroflexaceae bacterium]MDW8390604.1 alpha/beta hydrolase [Oscillochloridaceae bacterium]